MSPEEIKAIRTEAGLTQEQMAVRLGVTAGTLGNWETGKTAPNRWGINALKQAQREMEKIKRSS